MLRLHSIFLLVALFLVGCGRRAVQEVASSPEASNPLPYEEAHPAGKSSGERAYAPSESSAAEDAAPSLHTYRPGLATSWGETRKSQVHSAFFERQDERQPTDWARVVYDDEAGIRAATGTSYLQPRPHEAYLLGGALAVRIVDDDDDALPSVNLGTASYVIASHGERYQIQVENRSGRRFEIVATVDGLDVLDGRPGSFEKRGYLVGPYASLLIEGFRMSTAQVAAFRFGSVAHSYAAARGDARNVGVIGVAAFAERHAAWAHPHHGELERRQNADPFPQRYATPPGY